MRRAAPLASVGEPFILTSCKHAAGGIGSAMPSGRSCAGLKRAHAFKIPPTVRDDGFFAARRDAQEDALLPHRRGHVPAPRNPKRSVEDCLPEVDRAPHSPPPPRPPAFPFVPTMWRFEVPATCMTIECIATAAGGNGTRTNNRSGCGYRVPGYLLHVSSVCGSYLCSIAGHASDPLLATVYYLARFVSGAQQEEGVQLRHVLGAPARNASGILVRGRLNMLHIVGSCDSPDVVHTIRVRTISSGFMFLSAQGSCPRRPAACAACCLNSVPPRNPLPYHYAPR